MDPLSLDPLVLDALLLDPLLLDPLSLAPLLDPLSSDPLSLDPLTLYTLLFVVGSGFVVVKASLMFKILHKANICSIFWLAKFTYESNDMKLETKDLAQNGLKRHPDNAIILHTLGVFLSDIFKTELPFFLERKHICCRSVKRTTQLEDLDFCFVKSFRNIPLPVLLTF